MLYQAIDRCRSCGATQLPEVLNLGEFSISDFKEAPDAFTDRAPLELVCCQGCSLVQLRHTVARDRLYTQYWYRSGTQPAMVSALQDIVSEGLRRVTLSAGDTVIDIGANDGTLLKMYPPGLRRIAYEPAENLWPALRGATWDGTQEPSPIYGYFPQVLNDKVVGMDPPAKLITSIACFYDVDDPNQFVEGIKACLAPGGIWINQLAYLPDTLRTGNFGDVCHEHLTYWTIASFGNLLKRHGLVLLNWSHNDVNGGSIRFVVGHDTGQSDLTDYGEMRDLDWSHFRERIQRQRFEVLAWLSKAERDGKHVIGYGASTKGNTYLQYWNVDPELLPLIADRNPEKWGTYTPTGQFVISEAEARDRKPDYFFCLPWHFIEAFVEREGPFLADGGQFAVPFPELHFVGGEHASTGEVSGISAAGELRG